MTAVFVLLFFYLLVGGFLALLTGAVRHLNRREWLLPLAIVLWPFLMLMLIAFVIAWMLHESE